MTFDGFNLPTYTQVPSEIFDVLMPDLTGAELKVLLYICRRTFGFLRSSDDISLSQIENGITRQDGTQLDRGTGLGRSSVKRALTALESKNIIIRQQNQDHKGGHLPTTYALRFKGRPTSGPTLGPPAAHTINSYTIKSKEEALLPGNGKYTDELER